MTNLYSWIIQYQCSTCSDTRVIPRFVAQKQLLYINSQSRFFLVFHWSRAYHVRVTNLGCLPRNSARGRQYVIDQRITKKKSRAPSREDATFGHA